MRKIKFRGIPTDNNTSYDKEDGFVEGSLIKDNDKYYIVLEVIDNIKRDDYAIYMIEVIPETVGQYTGLKDKNGQEIYEGDIVYIKGETELLDIKGKVEYNDSWAQFVITNTGNIINETEPLGDYEKQDLEVIGNIYDNPELLKK